VTGFRICRTTPGGFILRVCVVSFAARFWIPSFFIIVESDRKAFRSVAAGD
jgi:hypothetical protein